jgi:hypothetical protein
MKKLFLMTAVLGMMSTNVFAAKKWEPCNEAAAAAVGEKCSGEILNCRMKGHRAKADCDTGGIVTPIDSGIFGLMQNDVKQPILGFGKKKRPKRIVNKIVDK